MGANQKQIQRIMSDIYGTQINTLEYRGLADAEDAHDLSVKLETIRDIWEDLVPGYHSWFIKKRVPTFEQCLVMSARESLKISGRFYSNGLELKHHLLKKKLSDLNSDTDIKSVTETLTKWVNENYLDEAKKAITGHGKYRLSIGYEQFYVDPVTWLRWNTNRRNQHFQTSLAFNPSSYNKYKKPAEAGWKRKPGSKRRADMPEPDIFDDIVPFVQKNVNQVTPLKITKSKTKNTSWEVQKNLSPAAAVHTADMLDPMRVNTKVYTLVHKSDKSGFPASVKRCEECKVAFMPSDIIAVKTFSIREYTSNVTGKQKQNHGNVYIHYLQSCLKRHDQKFEFKSVIVPNKTKKYLSDDQIKHCFFLQ